MSEFGLTKALEGQILGPESPFAVHRTELRKEWGPIVESGKDITITDVDSHELAVGHGRLLQQSSKNLEEFYKPIKKQIDALKKIVLDAEKADIGAITTVKDSLGQKVQAYNREQDRLHMEAMRIAAERSRKEAEERKIADAIAAESEGFKEEAEKILNEIALEEPSIVQTYRTKKSGEVEKTRWIAIVENLSLLVQAVADGKVPIMAIEANQAWLNKQATSFQSGLNYPGVTAKDETKVHFRA